MYTINDKKFDEIVQSFGTKCEILHQQAKIVQEWMKTQPHLPEILELRVIKNFLLQTKMSTEVAKQKIDAYFTLRSRMDIFSEINPNLPNMKELNKIIYLMAQPQLFGDSRVTFFKLRDESLVSKLEPVNVVRHLLNLREIWMRKDFCIGQAYAFDCQKIPASFYLNVTPTLIAQALMLYENVYSSRLKGVYFINLLPVAEKMLLVIKSMMKPKLFQRIHILNSLEELQNVFPKDFLPEEFGGTAESLETLKNKLLNEFQVHQDFFNHLDTVKVNESLRPEELKNDETLGFHGNFRKFEVD